MKTNSETDVIHWVWFENPDETLCGKDVTGDPWVTDEDPITCKGCLEIEKILIQSEMMELEINA